MDAKRVVSDAAIELLLKLSAAMANSTIIIFSAKRFSRCRSKRAKQQTFTYWLLEPARIKLG